MQIPLSIKTNRKKVTLGSILREEIKERKWSITDLAMLIDLPIEDTERLIEGKLRLTDDIAYRLSIIFGTSREFWLNLSNSCRNKEILSGI